MCSTPWRRGTAAKHRGPSDALVAERPSCTLHEASPPLTLRGDGREIRVCGFLRFQSCREMPHIARPANSPCKNTRICRFRLPKGTGAQVLAKSLNKPDRTGFLPVSLACSPQRASASPTRAVVTAERGAHSRSGTPLLRASLHAR